jgi:hypothetical protein
MGTGDGHVIGMTKIVDHGDPALRWNLVILGDGYQTGQIAQFDTDASNVVAKIQGEPPFSSVWTAINVYRIDVSSTDSGAADPTACGGTGATPHTYFDASFCNNGIRRLLEVNDTTVHNVVNTYMPQAHMIMVLVNSQVYGGSGGSVATVSLATGAEEIALHEMGHTAFGFADEYEYYAGCGVDPPGTHDRYTGAEPGQPNITANANRTTNKWASLVAAATPMPTTKNANCALCDPQGNPFSATTVGTYEGAGYFHCALYRPQFNCRMRALGNPFCAVCQAVIRKTISPYIPILQHNVGNNKTISMPWVSGGWVYFRGTDDKLWAIKTDGTGQKNVGGNTMTSTPCVPGDGWIYFQGTDDQLWAIKTDGTGQRNVGGNKTASMPWVSDGWVYFRGTDDQLWTIKTDGTGQRNLGGNKTASSPCAPGDGWVYFQGTDSQLWAIKTDGTGQRNVGGNKTASTPFSPGDGWLYFQGTDNQLWTIKTDGTGQRNVGGNKTASMPWVFDGWVYFRGTDNQLWTIKTDGTQQRNVGGNATSSTPFAASNAVYFRGTDNQLWCIGI